jgi:predicted negative regulator of RcsB-dependent stress response
MTTPINETETGAFAARQPRATSFMDWFHVNRVWVATAGAAVVIAGIVAWYVPHDRLIKSGVADKMLLDAKQSIQSGNVQLAESDLKKVADRYPKLPSGVEAGMLVGQLRLDRGDVAGAVTYLQGLVAQTEGTVAAASARGLLADALSQSNKPADAAAEYERAAGATTMPNEKALLMSKAGYAWMNANRIPEARKVWQSLATSPESQGLSAEAKVRLGELDAATKS